jgi:hypothetical protein
MKKSKIMIDPFILNKISNSNVISNSEKIHFLKYVWYMTGSERKELAQVV